MVMYMMVYVYNNNETKITIIIINRTMDIKYKDKSKVRKTIHLSMLFVQTYLGLGSIFN